MAAREAVQRYVRSYDIVELLLCLAFAAVGARAPYAWDPSGRMGVPHQTVDADADDGEGGGGEGQLLFDLTFDRNSTGETISTTLLVVLGIVLPLVLQCVLATGQVWLEERQNDGGESRDASHCEGGVEDVEGMSANEGTGAAEDERRYFFIHSTLCTYATTIGMALLFTESIKRYVGYMRPNFYQLCEPEMNGAAGMVCNDEASVDTDIERYQSFPSGHASVAYAGLTLLTMFLGRFFGFPPQGNNTILRNRTRLRRLSYFVSVLLVQSLAMWMATTRLADLVHHPADVLAGAVLGAGCAVFVDGLWGSV